MRSTSRALAGLLLGLVPVLSSAQLSVGARSGYSAAAGDLREGVPFTQGADGFVPVQLDFGWELGAGFTLGAYGSYGIGVMNASRWAGCGAGVECRARSLRTGLQLTWAMRRASASFLPWLAVGAGYEWFKLDVSGPDGYLKDTWGGPELANVQFGMDVKTWNPTFGPFVMLSVGRFDQRRLNLSGDEVSGAVQDRTLHHQIAFGLRARIGG